MTKWFTGDAGFISLMLAIAVAVGLFVFFNGGGWIGLAVYAIVLSLITGYGG